MLLSRLDWLCTFHAGRFLAGVTSLSEGCCLLGSWEQLVDLSLFGILVGGLAFHLNCPHGVEAVLPVSLESPHSAEQAGCLA